MREPAIPTKDATLGHYQAQAEAARQITQLQEEVERWRNMCERLQAQADEMRRGRQWVSVEDRLPPETHAYGCHTDDVLCRTADGKTVIAMLAETTTGPAWLDTNSRQVTITHWMPIPASPTTSGDGQHE